MPEFVIKPTLQTIIQGAVCVTVVPDGDHNTYSVYEVVGPDRMDHWVADFGEREPAEHFVKSLQAASALKTIFTACDRPTRGPRAHIDFIVTVKKAIESVRPVYTAVIS